MGFVDLPVGGGVEECDPVDFGFGRVNALFSPLGVEREIFGDGIGAKVPCFGESAVILVPTGEVAVFFGRSAGLSIVLPGTMPVMEATSEPPLLSKATVKVVAAFGVAV